MFKRFGNQESVFVNQDEGMFVALPITLDENSLTLETETRNGRKYVKAGSLVKEGTVVRGIMAEEYDITYGPVNGRIALEGWAWANKLTPLALSNVSNLPKIVVMPYKFVLFEKVSVDATNHKLVVKCAQGAKFNSGFGGTDITITLSGGATATYAVSTDGSQLTITGSASSDVEITEIKASGLIGMTSGSAIKGLPIEASI